MTPQQAFETGFIKRAEELTKAANILSDNKGKLLGGGLGVASALPLLMAMQQKNDNLEASGQLSDENKDAAHFAAIAKPLLHALIAGGAGTYAGHHLIDKKKAPQA
jgi:hypothetical protein